MNVSIHLCEFLVVFCHVLVEDPYGVIVHDGVGKVHMRNIDFGGLQNIQAFAGIWVPDTQSIIIRLADNAIITKYGKAFDRACMPLKFSQAFFGIRVPDVKSYQEAEYGTLAVQRRGNDVQKDV